MSFKHIETDVSGQPRGDKHYREDVERLEQIMSIHNL